MNSIDLSPTIPVISNTGKWDVWKQAKLSCGKALEGSYRFLHILTKEGGCKIPEHEHVESQMPDLQVTEC